MCFVVFKLLCVVLERMVYSNESGGYWLIQMSLYISEAMLTINIVMWTLFRDAITSSHPPWLWVGWFVDESKPWDLKC